MKALTMKTFERISILAVALALPACSGSSSVEFLGNRTETTAKVYSPGLSSTNGGFTNQATTGGHIATLSLGAPVTEVQSVSATGTHIMQFNVVGQLSQ